MFFPFCKFELMWHCVLLYMFSQYNKVTTSLEPEKFRELWTKEGKVNNNSNSNNRFTALCLGLPGWAVPEETFTHTYPGYQPLFISFHHLLACLTVFLYDLFPSPFFYLLVCNSALHASYISSPNHCLIFTTHAHAIATCFPSTEIMSSIPSLEKSGKH